MVVTSGKPSFRSKRIWWPNTLVVPVPVRSALCTPCVCTWRMKSSYWLRTGRDAVTQASPKVGAGARAIARGTGGSGGATWSNCIAARRA